MLPYLTIVLPDFVDDPRGLDDEANGQRHPRRRSRRRRSRIPFLVLSDVDTKLPDTGYEGDG